MRADDPSTRFKSISLKTNKSFPWWCAVLALSATPSTNPRLSAPSRLNRVAILRYTQRAWILTGRTLGNDLDLICPLAKGEAPARDCNIGYHPYGRSADASD